ncbi:hypothetical protein GCM10022381_20320 [Leifsonia kafniensis]|uniref:DUF3618 domain-containing protein n=1 Tax=Leifsonia kafniensis TaxID=475957 RepID=A0ABP7KKJ7_9MICO
MSSSDDSKLDAVADAASGILRDTAKKATSIADDVSTAIGDATSRVAESASEARSQAQHSVDESVGFIHRQLRERPGIVLAGVAVVAFMLGAAMGRKPKG